MTERRREEREGWIRPYMRRYGAMLATAIAINALAFTFAAGLMFTSGYMISLAAALPLTVLVLHLPSIFVRIFGIGKPLLGYGERMISHNWVLRMTSEMRRSLYDALERKSYALRSSERLGGILALLTEDIGHVQDLFLKSVIPFATSWLVALLLVVCMGLFSIQMALLFAVMLVVVAVAMPMFSVLANSARLAQKAVATAELYDMLTDNVEGLSDWVLSGNFSGYKEHSLALRDQLRRIDAKIRRYGRRHDLIMQALFGICITALLLWACTVFAAMPNDAGESIATGLAEALGNIGSENSPAYAPNWIAAFVLCIFPLLEAFAGSSHAALELKERRAALERMKRFSDNEPLTEHYAFGGREEDAAQVPNKPDIGTPDIDIRSLSFAYDESNEEVLHDVSLHIPYGQHVAILGKSGCGKTTLAALIHGDFAPTEGTCMVGSTAPSNPETGMTTIAGIVSQDPYIFNLSLRDNLKLADPKATDTQLIEALRSVGLHERFEKLPRGLDTVIDSHGRSLSGGEAHRVAVARILLAKQPVVILDEPFAGLDPETERALLETIMDTLGNRTIVTITHHLDNIEMFDRVIFMQDIHDPALPSDAEDRARSIAFNGTPEELAGDKRYGRLLRLSR